MAGSVRFFANCRDIEMGQKVRALRAERHNAPKKWVNGKVRGFRGSLVLVKFEGVEKEQWMYSIDLAAID